MISACGAHAAATQYCELEERVGGKVLNRMPDEYLAGIGFSIWRNGRKARSRGWIGRARSNSATAVNDL
ncbi:MAG: hypothetical protein KGM47_10640 [Acidobacteriota bacterium]|nr:hypothetical protein [Acidobacteriota bacterium]